MCVSFPHYMEVPCSQRTKECYKIMCRLKFTFLYVSVGLSIEKIINPLPTFQNLEVELQFSYLLVLLRMDSTAGFHSSLIAKSFLPWVEKTVRGGQGKLYFNAIPIFYILLVEHYLHFYAPV